MKKIVKFFAISLAAIAALVSCRKELEIQTPEDSANVRTVVFTAGIDTKTVFGEQSGNTLPTLWTNTDGYNSVAVSLNFSTVKKSSEIVVSNNGASAQFEVAITEGGTTPYVFYAISPYPAVASVNSNFKSANLTIPALQTPSASSVDEAAQIVYAKYDAGDVFPESVSSMQFSHLTAYGRIAFTNLTLADGEDIEKVTLTAPVNWVGKFYYYLEDHDPYSAGDWAEQATSSNILTINTSRTDNIWFACAPVDLGGQKVKVVITTDKATTYTKEITIPDGKKFESGKVNSFPINMNGISADAPSDESWEETAIADLTSSDVFVIVGNNGSTFAMSNDKGTTAAPSAVAVTVSGNKLVGDIADNIKWNISGNATDGYVFYPDGSTTTWLYTTTSNNGLRVGDSDNKFVSFEAASGYMTIYDGATTRYIGIYNSSDWRSYSSINNNIKNQTFKFYKKSDKKTALASPTNVAAAVNDDGDIDVTWTDTSAPSGVTVSYKVTCTGKADQNIASGVQKATFEDIEDGTYDITVTAVPSANDTYKESAAVATSLLVGLPSLAKPEIKSFSQTATGFSAVINAAVENATSYDWALYVGSVDASNKKGSGNTTSLSFDVAFADTDITEFTVGSTYLLVVTAKADGYKNGVSESKSFVAANLSASYTIAEILTAGNATSTTLGSGTVMAKQGNYTIISDNTGSILAFKATGTYEIGDIVSVTGAISTYSNAYQFNQPAVTVNSSPGAPSYPADNVIDSEAQLTSYATGDASTVRVVYATLKGTVDSNGKIVIGAKTVTVYNALSSLSGKAVVAQGYLTGYYNSNIYFVNVSAVEDSSTPTLNVSATSLEWSATEFGSNNAKQITVTLNGSAAAGDYTVSGSSSDWTVSDNQSGTITVYPNAANTDTENAKSLTLTISHKSDSSVKKEVTLTQAKASSGGGTAPTSVSYDFTGSGWTVSNGTLSNGTVSFTGAGAANFKMNGGYFFMGKSGAYINFPTYEYPVTKIVVTGRSGASGSVKQNIFVGDTAVSTETTGATGENTYNIASGYQAAGTVYTLKVTSSHNTQITKIEVFF